MRDLRAGCKSECRLVARIPVLSPQNPKLLTSVSSSPAWGSPVTQGRRPTIAVALLFLSIAGWGQQSRRPHSTAPPAEGAPTAENTTELETFSRAVAIQARPEQVGYFQSAIQSTDAALQQSRDLANLSPAGNTTPNLNAKSLQLRDTLDDVEHYSGKFLASFSKTQQTELKKLTRNIHKSYSVVSKEAGVVAQHMEPGRVVLERLKSSAANLEKALSDFRSDQIRLAREMGIQSN